MFSLLPPSIRNCECFHYSYLDFDTHQISFPYKPQRRVIHVKTQKFFSRGAQAAPAGFFYHFPSYSPYPAPTLAGRLRRASAPQLTPACLTSRVKGLGGTGPASHPARYSVPRVRLRGPVQDGTRDRSLKVLPRGCPPGTSTSPNGGNPMPPPGAPSPRRLCRTQGGVKRPMGEFQELRLRIKSSPRIRLTLSKSY